MSEQRLRVVVTGAMGRMGQALIRSIVSAEKFELIGATERHDHPDIAKDVGQLVLGRVLGISLENDLRNTIVSAQAIIDFTHPDSSLIHADIAALYGLPIVIGTTGFSSTQKETIRAFAEKTRIVQAPNMSVGVNLLFYLAQQAARTIGDESDIEIVETHHRDKVDAPSGTALRLAEIVGEAIGHDEPATRFEYGRKGQVGPRSSGKIGLHAVRGGEVVGKHELYFYGAGEELCLTHLAYNRDNFVRGALRAAQWLQNQPNGLYGMGEVLGLS